MANITCPRCDRQYSSFRSRCPYCGAFKNNKGKRAADRDNAGWKMIAGSVIILILIASVAAVLIMTIAGNKAPDVGVADKDKIAANGSGNQGGTTTPNGSSANNPSGSGVNGSGTTPGADPNGTTPPAAGDKPEGSNPTAGDNPNGGDDNNNNPAAQTPAAGLKGLRITTRGGDERTDITMKAGDTVRLSYRTDPDDYAGTVKWESADTSKLTVSQSGELKALQKGSVKIKITLEDKTAECIVRIIEP